MNRILAALVNGAALGALVTAAVWLVLGVIPRRVLNAATRYVLWWATLAVAIALPALYLPIPQFHRVELAQRKPTDDEKRSSFPLHRLSAGAWAGSKVLSKPSEIGLTGASAADRTPPAIPTAAQ